MTARASCVTRRTMSASRSCVTSIATMPPNRTPRRRVAEDRGAEPDQPGDAGRMIEKGKRALLRPGPVIGLVGTQIEHAGIDQPHRRQRGDQQRDGKPGRRKPWRRGGTGLAFMGLGDRHGAFSSTAPEVSTCRGGKTSSSSLRTQGPIPRDLSIARGRRRSADYSRSLLKQRSLPRCAPPAGRGVWVPAPVRNCALGRDDQVDSSRSSPHGRPCVRRDDGSIHRWN